MNVPPVTDEQLDELLTSFASFDRTTAISLVREVKQLRAELAKLKGQSDD